MELDRPPLPRKTTNARRLRHHCITISHTMDTNASTAAQLTTDPAPKEVDGSKPQQLLVVGKNEGNKSRSQSVSTLPCTKVIKNRPTVHSSCGSTASVQRSVSLHEFDDNALPVNVTAPVSPIPPTPVSKTSKQSQFMTRRSSSLQGEVFTANELEFGRTLGTGFFGKAIQVKHKVTGEIMVVKQLLTCDEDSQKSFLREAAVLRSLSHPKLLKYIGFLYKGRELHIVTEYIPGGTLENLLHHTSDPLDLHKKLSLAIDIASAMEYLHSEGILHRDLNSPNCLLRNDGSVVVSDFGLSKLVQTTPTSSDECNKKLRKKKKRHTVVGNPYWMAPEMIRGEHYDERVDVFSFGIIICEIVGRVKADPDYMPRLNNFALDELTFLDKFGSCCPQEFIRCAFQCCAMKADDRPSFQKVNKDLIRIYKLRMSGGRLVTQPSAEASTPTQRELGT